MINLMVSLVVAVVKFWHIAFTSKQLSGLVETEKSIPLQQSSLRKHSRGYKWYPTCSALLYLFVTRPFLNMLNVACCILP
ncbi:hypothetical protein L6452_14551 [Arctium lappa]|uniref:Uncharacterized protein n=1 Tax=Arctium lappa TaxID=4217 RepID=A0ACB9CLB9_ARCLA|nr:hypothetical protein L6452_14551 [Arctium lappa]